MTSNTTLDVTQAQHQPHHPDRPSPIVTELRREPERYINEIIWLTAKNPEIGEEPSQRLMVVLNDRNTESDVLVDLRTNDPSCAFVAQVIRQHFSKWHSIYETWPAIEPF